jgi:glycogen debranching enzyme
VPTQVPSVGAATSLAHDGWTVLLCGPDGSIDGGPSGLWDHDCRVLSRHVLRLDGRPLIPIGSPNEAGRAWSASLHAQRPGGTAKGPALPQDAWEVELERTIGPGLRERITVRNHSMTRGSATLELELAADFGDALRRGRPGGPRGRTTIGRGRGALVTLRWTATRGDRRDERGVRVRLADGPRPSVDVAGRAGALLTWQLHLPARGEWRATLDLEVPQAEPVRTWLGPDSAPERAAKRLAWQARRTRCEGDPIVGSAFERAADDLLALRAWELDPAKDGSAWLPNAGVPWFTGLFGRDVLTAGWQAAMLGPEIVRGAIEITARTQGRRLDPITEEEPGRIIHERRAGPLALLGVTSHAGYYGNQTASSFFPVALSEAWHWTGDDDLLAHHRSAAWRTLEWADRFGDRDDDGFLEYLSSSSGGLRNQGWKDSDEAIRYPDGSIVDAPISTIEEQAFHILALERTAEILVALDEPGDDADRLLGQAADLRRRLDEAFWLEDERFYAMALDARKRPVASIGSNPLHALAAGVIPADKAGLVADRLLGAELFSGWGIRTLAPDHPSFNPLAYHLGAVWPVENATAMIGFRRYGLDDHLDRLLDAFFAALRGCPDGRLPEALTGHDRRDDAAPLPYPEANPIQAWSASAVIQATQAMLGIYPFAPAGVLALVRPRLPAWLPALTLRRLRVGTATVSLRFERNADGSASHEVLEQDGRLLVVGAPPPNQADGRTPDEWLADFAIRHAPGRLARALRIALGLQTSRAPAGAGT